MNGTTTILHPQERAVLVSRNDDGSERRQIVGQRDSVLDIKSDLIKHLNEQPVSDEWLADLRDYCDGRLKARSEARATRTIIFPQGAHWGDA
jgi:hypothetical protein